MATATGRRQQEKRQRAAMTGRLPIPQARGRRTGSTLPAVAGCVVGLVGGLWSDWMLKRGFDLTASRKTPIISGLFLSSTIVVANHVQSTTIVILVMSIAFFAKGVGNLGWYIVGDVSPGRAMGASGGIFNLCGNLASIVTPLAIGWMIKSTGSFEVALAYIGALSLHSP